MLKNLRVYNFALIENVSVDFETGLNILTGETGAGKSILIDALGGVLGKKLSTDFIRTGEDYLKIEATFELENKTLLISRRISKSGRNSIKIDDENSNITELKKLGSQLVEIHGQLESMELLKESIAYDLLDRWLGLDSKFLTDYRKIFSNWYDKKKQFEEFLTDAEKFHERRDLLEWQLQEIDSANVQPDEIETLERELKKLSHAEKIATLIKHSCELLDGSDEADGIITALARVKKNLSELMKFDETLSTAEKMLDEAETLINEATSEIKSYSEDFEFSPEILEQKQSRLAILDRLEKKYGDVLKYREQIISELNRFENVDEEKSRLEFELQKLESDLQKSANNLTLARIEQSKIFSEKIKNQLRKLGMVDAKIFFEIKPLENFTPRGKDQIAIYFSANAGEMPKLLSKVASGGEISRISLAVQTVLSEKNSNAETSIVFDEIDTGLGGKTAGLVADSIYKIARSRQALCITHLPQIASVADVHISIEKITADSRTITKVHRLNFDERVHEIARMSSGNESSTALENARAMLLRKEDRFEKL